MCNMARNLDSVVLPVDGEATSKFALTVIRRHSATGKYLFLYPQGDRSDL